jgi:hypothetical protein
MKASILQPRHVVCLARKFLDVVLAEVAEPEAVAS